jgi:hypothetical protein
MNSTRILIHNAYVLYIEVNLIQLIEAMNEYS